MMFANATASSAPVSAVHTVAHRIQEVLCKVLYQRLPKEQGQAQDELSLLLWSPQSIIILCCHAGVFNIFTEWGFFLHRDPKCCLSLHLSLKQTLLRDGY